MKKIISAASVGAVMIVLAAGVPAFAAPSFSPTNYALFGSSTYVNPGENSNQAVEITSNSSTSFGGIDYGFAGTSTLADVQHLATDYMFTAGSCAGGSPRFSIAVSNGSTTGNIFVYLGPSPNYTGCAANTWVSSGELVGNGTVDTSQLPGGSFYDTWAHAESAYGAYAVTDIAIVVDGGWALPATGQTVDIDNTTINSTVYTYEASGPTLTSQCKNGGWQNYTDANGNMFKNQGDCVSYVATGGKNGGSISP